MPAPSTPSLATLEFATPAGRRMSLSASPLLMKVVRMRLRETGSQSSFAKYLLQPQRLVEWHQRAFEHAVRMAIGAG